MTATQNTRVMLRIFDAIERRDDRGFTRYVDPRCEFHWPPSLLYGGVERPFGSAGPNWRTTWDPLQPTDIQRAMEPRVVAADGDEVVVLWRQRGLNPGGEHFDGEAVGIYQLRDEKLLRAQMFYFDTSAVDRFLRRSIGMTQPLEAP